MVYDIVTKVTLETFRERSADKKLILLYPWTTYRTLFLTHFLSSHNSGLLYYRIADGQDTLSSWMTAMVDEFNEVLGGFGQHVRQALTTDNPAALGEALAADLAAYQQGNLAVFLDEFDRIPVDGDLFKFAQALIASLPQGIQIAISSRLLTYQPWYDMVARGEAIVLGTEYRKDDVMFTVEPKMRPQLEVYSLGRGHALVNGQPITNWDGALPRNLFFYFMDHHLVTRDEIFNTFWPELSVKEATNVFHVTKRKISERISMKVFEGGNYELTQYSGGFYVPSEKVMRHYDVGEFQAAIEQAMMTSNDEEEERLLTQAIEFYKAPFLQTVEMPWVENRRDHLRQLFAQALISMGRLYKRRGDNLKSVGYFIRSLKETPEREDIHREIMNIYLKLGRTEDARAQYRQLAETLNTRLGINPSRESQELFSMIETTR
ncbi:MAG TPA: bacterial transcriptional activator domain-containing protein [Phototrophicaceae bacterium]|nr:bacterial transcriptional activator domain-containing protein [Phototrophicaceae bacterium]